ncbi:hypothetical protein RHECNPAF_1740012 [Rhizobium etli CNPAF512]|nr:hypothetical protein RHECNPAF_1740012 [Rhizobium etli CNPAF512]
MQALQSLLRCGPDDTTLDLIRLDRLEKSAEIAFAETFVTLALDEFEEDRADDGFRENLQQDFGHAAIHHAFAVDEDAVFLHALDRFTVAVHAFIGHVVIGLRRTRHEAQAVVGKPVCGPINILGADGDVLDALAAVLLQIFLDLAGVVLRFIQRNADLAAGRGDGAADQTGDAAVYIEEVDLLEIEQLTVEIPPLVHVAAEDIVGEMVEIVEADPLRARVRLAQPVEFGIVGRSLGAIGLDEIKQRAANADNCRNIKHLVIAFIGDGALRHRMVESVFGVDDTPSHRCSAGTVLFDEAGGVTAGFGIDDIVDVALAPDSDVFRLVPGDGSIAHACEELVELFRFGMRELDEFETVGAGRVVGSDFGWRRIMRERAHFLLPMDWGLTAQSVAQNACKILAFFMAQEDIMHGS